MPRDRQRTTEGGNFGSSQTLWENGDHCGGNRRLGNRFGTVSQDSQGACASGGTVKDRTIELQGDHKKRASKVLEQWVQGGGKMMSRIINLLWISHTLCVVNSDDPTSLESRE